MWFNSNFTRIFSKKGYFCGNNLKNNRWICRYVWFSEAQSPLCDYFSAVAEAANFQVNCISSSFKYRSFDDEVFIHDSSIRIK